MVTNECVMRFYYKVTNFYSSSRPKQISRMYRVAQKVIHFSTHHVFGIV